MNETFADGGAVVIGTTGQFVRVEGGTVTPLTMTIAGQQISGAFVFEQTTSGGADKNLLTTETTNKSLRVAIRIFHWTSGRAARLRSRHPARARC